MPSWESLFRPYVYQCEAVRCLRSNRDLDNDESPHYHPECLEHQDKDSQQVLEDDDGEG